MSKSCRGSTSRRFFSQAFRRVSASSSTARQAYDKGYNVVLVTDAMTDRAADAHRHSVEKIFPRIGETTTTDEALNLLQHAD